MTLLMLTLTMDVWLTRSVGWSTTSRGALFAAQVERVFNGEANLQLHYYAPVRLPCFWAHLTSNSRSRPYAPIVAFLLPALVGGVLTAVCNFAWCACAVRRCRSSWQQRRRASQRSLSKSSGKLAVMDHTSQGGRTQTHSHPRSRIHVVCDRVPVTKHIHPVLLCRWYCWSLPMRTAGCVGWR